jgi:N-acetylmuramoyl-L-alanine amidase
MKKTAIVVGHTEDSPGACSPHNISCEWEFNFGVAVELVMREKADLFLYDTYSGGYTNMVKRNIRQINQGQYDLILELHYNGHDDPKINGCEALYHHKDTENYNEVALAEKFCHLMQKEVGVKSRGAKVLTSKNEKGYAALYYPKCDALILEPFFGSNISDVNNIRNQYYSFIGVLEQLIDD